MPHPTQRLRFGGSLSDTVRSTHLLTYLLSYLLIMTMMNSLTPGATRSNKQKVNLRKLINQELCNILLLLYPIWLYRIQLEPDLAEFRNSNLDRARVGENLFWDHKTIHVIKLMVSTMLTADIKRQYSSALSLLGHRLPVFDEICRYDN